MEPTPQRGVGTTEGPCRYLPNFREKKLLQLRSTDAVWRNGMFENQLLVVNLSKTLRHDYILYDILIKSLQRIISIKIKREVFLISRIGCDINSANTTLVKIKIVWN